MEGKTTKQQYEAPKLEIVMFETEDIMTNSNETDNIPVTLSSW